MTPLDILLAVLAYLALAAATIYAFHAMTRHRDEDVGEPERTLDMTGRRLDR